MAIPKHFSLVQEHPHSYEIHDSRDGKRFHVAKHGLNLGMHANLAKIQRFDDGGAVKNDNPPDPTLKRGKNLIGYPGSEGPTSPKPVQGYDEGGTVAVDQDKAKKVMQGFGSMGLANGGESESVTIDPTLLSKPISPEEAFKAAQAYRTAEAGKENREMPYGTTPDVQYGTNAPLAPSVEPAESPNTTEVESTPQESATSSIAPSAPESSPTEPTSQDPFAQQSTNVIGSLEQERNAIQTGAEAEALASKKSAQAINAMQENEVPLSEIQDRYTTGQKADDELFKKYMSKELDPDQYWHSKGTGSKIAASIGMILGGMGAAMTGGPNYAMQTINNAIERDMEAQKNEQGKAMNAWKMHREATQSNLQADLLFRNQAYLGVKAKLAQFAAEAGGPQALARAAGPINQLNQEINGNRFLQSMLAGSESGRTINADPAMFLSKVPPQFQAEAAKEITANKTLALTRQHTLETFNKIKQINTLGNRVGSPFQTKAQVDDLRDNAAVELARDEAGRVNEFEFKAAQKAFHGAGNDASTDQIKLNNLMSIINKKQNPGTVFKQYTGLDLDRFSGTSARAGMPPDPVQMQMQYMRQNANSQDPQVQARVRFLRQKFAVR